MPGFNTQDATFVAKKQFLNPEVEKMFKQKALLLAAQRQQGTLTDLKGKPDTTNKNSAERNKDYLNNPLNKERLLNNTKQLGQMIRPIVGSAAVASGAVEAPAALGLIGRGAFTLGKGALQGLGFGALGMGTGSTMGDISAGMAGETLLPIAQKVLPQVANKASNLYKNIKEEIYPPKFEPINLTGYHASNEPLTQFKANNPDNYFVKHGGTDKAIFFTDKIPEEQSFLSKRPYLSEFNIEMKNPYVVDFKTPTKGGTSNWAKKINWAEKKGYDGVVVKGIRDNQMDNSTIYVSLNPSNIKHNKFVKEPLENFKSAIGNNPNIYKSLESRNPNDWTEPFMIDSPYKLEEVTPAIKNAMGEARADMNSPFVRQAWENNSKVSTRINLPHTRHQRSMDLKFEQNGVDNWYDYRMQRMADKKTVNVTDKGPLGTFSPKGPYQPMDAINLRNNLEPETLNRAAKHETLHAAYNSEGDFMPIEAYKLNRIMKPRVEINKIGEKFNVAHNPEYDEYLADYLSTPEILTNTMDVANKLGIKPGTKYPGYEGFRNMLNNYKGEKGFMMESFKLDNKIDYKRVFDVMNRTALGTTPAYLLNKKGGQ